MQRDANDQPRMLLRALSNHVHNIILDTFSVTDDAGVFSRHHQHPITYLSQILHKVFETCVTDMYYFPYFSVFIWNYLVKI